MIQYLTSSLLYAKQHFIPTILTLSILSAWSTAAFILISIVKRLIFPVTFKPCKKHCYITGASQGLGKCLALKLAAQGAHVTIVARNTRLLEGVIKDMQAAGSLNKHEDQKFCMVVANVTDNAASCDALAVATRTIGCVPDYVFTIAGSASPGYMYNLDVEHYESQMKLNYLGTLYTIKEASRLMIENRVKGGKLIMCSSLAAFVGFLGMSAYTPSKSAVRGLAEVLRQEMILHGIDVHCAFPGSILTAGFAEENKTKPKLTREIEGDDGMTPEDVAESFMQGLRRNEAFIVCEPLGELLMAASLGFLPVNNHVVHIVCLMASLVVCPALRLYADFKVSREAAWIASLGNKKTREKLN